MAGRARVLVLGDVMLDQYIWGRVTRISPEAPVPVLEYDRESVMPGGAANVARNLTALGAQVELAGLVGNDEIATRLKALLRQCRVGCDGLLVEGGRPTSVKTRIIAHQQQVVRVDRESCRPLGAEVESRFERRVMQRLRGVDAVVVGDYGKGVVTQRLLEVL
nr:carbohydrate kinase [Verrucomicrobiota bacterium]